MPRAVIAAPPSEVTSPPSVALVAAMLALVGVVTVATPKPVNIYTAPELTALSLAVLFTPVVLLSSWKAPTTTVSPDTATDKPKASPHPALLALR